MTRLVKHPTLAQVTILWFVSSRPTSVSVLTAQSLGPPSDSVSPSLSDSCSVSLSKISKDFFKRQTSGYRHTQRQHHVSSWGEGDRLQVKERETECEWERGRERGRHSIQRRLQALSCQHRARRGARTHRP